MDDLSHLNAIQERLSHERMRLAASATPFERTFREVQVSQIEKELASERRFLGLPEDGPLPDMTDDELLAELFS
jgi:hypothetical protein